jgi:hypothetical protein
MVDVFQEEVLRDATASSDIIEGMLGDGSGIGEKAIR